ncbi:XRE family transcriptional regulator [Cupriavidus pampae]|nr:XRE family transcriptional regulator [Cupriavidus pampae]
MTRQKVRKKYAASVPLDKATVEALAQDPGLAAEFLKAALEELDAPDTAPVGLLALEDLAMAYGSPQGTHAVLQDLGFDDAEELSAKSVLARNLNNLLVDRRLGHSETVAITGMTPSELAQVRRYKLRNIGLEHLIWAVASMACTGKARLPEPEHDVGDTAQNCEIQS